MKPHNIDLSAVPTEALYSELGRRRNAQRETFGAGSGRPKKLTPCPKCQRKFGVAELRGHRGKCKG